MIHCFFNEPFVRVHNFQLHEEVKFYPLRTLGITNKLLEGMTKFFSELVDIPDTIFKLEEIAVNVNYFNDHLKVYISEEFNCQTEYSFSIISVLHYIHKYSVSLEDALSELFQLSTCQSLCEKCVTGGNPREREIFADLHNQRLLTSLLKESEISEVFASDDSFDDPEFIVPVDVDDLASSVDSSDDLCSNSDISEGFNPFTTEEIEANSEEEFSFNPFVEENNTAGNDVNKVLNSTIAFNPFHESERNFEEFKDCSSIQASPTWHKHQLQDVAAGR